MKSSPISQEYHLVQNKMESNRGRHELRTWIHPSCGRCRHLQLSALGSQGLEISFSTSGWLKHLGHELIACWLCREVAAGGLSAHLWLQAAGVTQPGVERAGPEFGCRLGQ